MVNLFEIINKRSCPAIFVFDLIGRVIFLNRGACDMCVELHNDESLWNCDIPFVNIEIFRLCENLKKTGNDCEHASDCGGVVASDTVIAICNGRPHAMRAFHVWEPGRERAASHIMVSIEGIIEKHEINYEKVKRDFRLSKREVEVLRLTCDGLTTKDISAKIFLSQHTVKDYMKSIMCKMKVHSRTELIACLK
jgi:DNA-binding CsgD family transcriptional regulator